MYTPSADGGGNWAASIAALISDNDRKREEGGKKTTENDSFLTHSPFSLFFWGFFKKKKKSVPDTDITRGALNLAEPLANLAARPLERPVSRLPLSGPAAETNEASPRSSRVTPPLFGKTKKSWGGGNDENIISGGESAPA